MARKRTRPVRVAAAFDPDGRPICPTCWSRPSVDGRIRNEQNAPRSGVWSLRIVDKEVRHDGRLFSYVSVCRYPCSNPECLTHIDVEWLGGTFGVQGYAHLLDKHQLKGEDAERYKAGYTDSKGIWHPEKPSTEEPLKADDPPKQKPSTGSTKGERKAKESSAPVARGGKTTKASNKRVTTRKQKKS